MKKTRNKLTLNRDTLRSLSGPALGEAAGGGTGSRQSCSCYITCATCTSCAGCTLTVCGTAC
jgi:hypothetical protein